MCYFKFSSCRIGKPIDNKAQSMLIEFAIELDRVDIVRSARKLKDLQAK